MLNKMRFQIPDCRGYWVVLTFALMSIFVIPTSARAHKVNIFAWVDGDMIHTQSKIGGGKRVKNSNVIVYNLNGKKLLEGETDDNGEFSFKIPSGSEKGLRIVLTASMGHAAEWTIPADEMEKAAGVSNNLPSSEAADTVQVKSMPSIGTEDRVQTAPYSSGLQSTGTKDCNYQSIQDMIDHSLDKKLAPVMDMLIKALDPQPTLRDIIGGIGYIVGLVGLSLYFMNRSKSD